MGHEKRTREPVCHGSFSIVDDSTATTGPGLQQQLLVYYYHQDSLSVVDDTTALLNHLNLTW